MPSVPKNDVDTNLTSAMFLIWAVNSSHRHVGPNDILAPKNDAGIGDAVAPQGTIFSQNRPKFTQTASHTLAVDAKVDFSSIVSQIAQFCSSTQVNIRSEYGISNVVEVRCFGLRKEN